jgi:hypothetical protein
LSEFEREQIAKLFLRCHRSEVEATSFESSWASYKIPLPIGMKSVADIYNAFLSAHILCIQDVDSKCYVDACKSDDDSIINVNEELMVVDRTIAEYRSNPNPTFDDMSELVRCISDVLVLINQWMFNIQMQASDIDDMKTECAKMFFPHSDFLTVSRDLINTVDSVAHCICKEDANIRTLALHGLVINYIQLSQFSMLCALMMDAFCISRKFCKAIVNIQQFIQYNFHNYYLYRVELPLTPLNDKPIAQRGSADHTTLMKIYLFDHNVKPVLLRIDLPHTGSVNLHINLSTTKGEKLQLDHYNVECDQRPEEITPVFDSLRESMELQTPNLYKMVDTTIKDEQKIFLEMQKFVDYFELCVRSLTKLEDF